MFSHRFFPAAFYAPTYYAPPAGAVVVVGGGMGSWVPFADIYAGAPDPHLRVSHGEPHPELNWPRREAEQRAAEQALALLEDDELLLLSVL